MSNTLDNLSRDEDAYVEVIDEKQVCLYIIVHHQVYTTPRKLGICLIVWIK